MTELPSPVDPAAGDAAGRQFLHAESGGTINAVQGGTLNVYQWRPDYRLEEFPAVPAPLKPRRLASQPSRLLLARHRVVDFTGRIEDLAELAAWRDDTHEPGVTVRLLHGAGGHGKTRLAARFAERSREQGWAVWQAVLHPVGSRSVTVTPLRGNDASAGVLLVIDYAERWPAPALYEALQDPMLHRGVPVRVLLVARPAGSWWLGLASWIDRALDAGTSDHPLAPLAGPDSRTVLFEHARARFAHHLGLPPEAWTTAAAPSGLETDPAYEQVLTIHIAALAAVDAVLNERVVPPDPARASAYLMGREHEHWAAVHQRTVGPVATPPATMGRVVLTAALTHPLRHDHGVAALAAARLTDDVDAANALLLDHQHCYPPTQTDTVLEPIYPDRLAEDFIGLTTPGHHTGAGDTIAEHLADGWADRLARRLLADPAPHAVPDPPERFSRPWTRNALTVLIETARRWPHIAHAQLYPLLDEYPELALQAGGAALAALADLPDIAPDLLEAVEAHLPEERHSDLDIGGAAVLYRLAHMRLAGVSDPLPHARLRDDLAVRLSWAGLREEAVTAGQDALNAWRHLDRRRAGRHEPELAKSLTNLGNYLAEVGRREEAVSAAQEAVDTYRRLAAADPGAWEPILAVTLTNLGGRLAEVGRREEALAVAEEGVVLDRRLAAANPAAWEPKLAMSLSNLGIHLSEAGRREEAVVLTREAAQIRRRLAAANPAAWEADLAASLTNLGAFLLRVGHREEALAVTQEGESLYRRLAKANPAAWEHGLASSLSNLGMLLSEAGRREEALAVQQEALEIRRRLAETNPAAWEDDLAKSLTNLGNRLWEVGRREEALAAEREALELRRRLAAANPLAYEFSLAASLSNLGVYLSGLGQREEALSVMEEAVDIYRRLVTASPAAWEPDLARALSNLAILLSDEERPEEALAVAEEAVGIYRRLAADNPDAWESDLARALSNLGLRLSDEERPEEALAVAEEGVAICRRLVTANPAAWEPGLATSLSNLGIHLSEVGRTEEALGAAEEAVGIYRRLAAANPAAWETDLAKALSSLGDRLSERGRRDEAAAVDQEASEIEHRLTPGPPE